MNGEVGLGSQITSKPVVGSSARRGNCQLITVRRPYRTDSPAGLTTP
jgi:hypothetical protein